MKNSHPLAIFVPWLHMHQPPIWTDSQPPQLIGNLEKMLNSEENSEENWNAQWFAQAYKNPARYVENLKAQGHSPRIMVDYSGVLLEELAKLSSNGYFDRLVVDGEPIGNVIELWRRVLEQHPEAVEFAGTAYSHCYFPATPQRDHEAQILTWRQVFADLFGEAALSRVKGFWLPEMGMTGDASEALEFIRLLKRCGYEWIILPHAALERPEDWSTPELENRVHWLEVESGGESERILCVVRDTDMGIRQQSGQNAEGCVDDIRYRGKTVQEDSDIPALIVPTSDGENGNVMMFEYFKNSFAPLFQQSQDWPEIGFMTVSEYMETYLNDQPTTTVDLKSTGGSWIGGHHSWQEGDLRQTVLQKVEQLSQTYANQRQMSSGLSSEQERALLLCETSCFVYWGSSFWAEQAERCIDWAQRLIAVE